MRALLWVVERKKLEKLIQYIAEIMLIWFPMRSSSLSEERPLKTLSEMVLILLI